MITSLTCELWNGEWLIGEKVKVMKTSYKNVIQMLSTGYDWADDVAQRLQGKTNCSSTKKKSEMIMIF